ncbi:MAG: styrene monooxygenase/indole monooxygenase family protein [Rhodococcus sp. (in: high G+C Gram-positive bacteria)]|uniref:styrene monooxygenase/indole monooxygenase family protein n=1 Tax=Rhodococcus sp. TaxID=1831 RepID=UPI003BB18B4D
MKPISIIGAGQAGTLLSMALQANGHQVNLYTDKTAEEILHNTSPTGTAALFHESVATERRLGCPGYDDKGVPMDALHLCFSPKVGQELVHFGSDLGASAGGAVDVRLKSYDRMVRLTELGGNVVVKSVEPTDLDDIAENSALTIVSTGKYGLSSLFQRNAERSVYDKPQRNLAMVLVRGIATDGSAFSNRVPGSTAVNFNLFGDAGEIFWVPFLHKSGENVWCLVFEAKPGGPLDVWADVTTASEAFATASRLAREFTPWDWPSMQQMEPLLDDPHSWLKGRVTPSVRAGLGTTPGGKPMMSLGDTSVAYDPIAGQGAGSGIRQAGHYFDAIVRHGSGDFDAQWIDTTFEDFYASHIAGTYRFTNLLLEPLDKTAVRIMTSCFADQKCATRFAQTFDAPPTAFPWIADRDAADGWIAENSGRAPGRVVASGLGKIAAGQLRNKLRGSHFPRAEARR